MSKTLIIQVTRGQICQKLGFLSVFNDQSLVFKMKLCQKLWLFAFLEVKFVKISGFEVFVMSKV